MRGCKWLGTALAVALTMAPSAQADTLAGARPAEEMRFPSPDGTMLHADVFRPAHLATDARTPVIIDVGPYFTQEPGGDPTGESPRVVPVQRPLFEMALERGYTVVNVSLRGRGESEGCPDYGGQGEQGDGLAAVRWAKSESWSDGHVAIFGHSYDGYAGLGALSAGAEPDAAVIASPVVSAYPQIWANGIAYFPPMHTGFHYLLGLTPPAGTPDDGWTAMASGPVDADCPTPHLAAELQGDPTSEFWRERDHLSKLQGNTTPLALYASRVDFSAKSDAQQDLWRAFAGPKQGYFAYTPHVSPADAAATGRGVFYEQAIRFLDHHVRGLPASATAQDPAVVVQEGGVGRWRTEHHWPPADVRPAALFIRAGSYQDMPGNKAESGSEPLGLCMAIESKCSPSPVSETGKGSWTFTKPLLAAQHLAGEPTLRVALASSAARVNLFALLYDLDAEGDATLMAHGAARVPGTGEASLRLWPLDWTVAGGHRLGVLLAGSYDFAFLPRYSGATVTVKGGALTLPATSSPRTPNLDGGPSDLIANRTTFRVPAATIVSNGG